MRHQCQHEYVISMWLYTFLLQSWFNVSVWCMAIVVYNVLACVYNVLGCVYNVLACVYNVLGCVYNVLGCTTFLLYSGLQPYSDLCFCWFCNFDLIKIKYFCSRYIVFVVCKKWSQDDLQVRAAYVRRGNAKVVFYWKKEQTYAPNYRLSKYVFL
jgi:hypothetical protein